MARLSSRALVLGVVVYVAIEAVFGAALFSAVMVGGVAAAGAVSSGVDPGPVPVFGCRWEPPVDAPIVDGFRPPPNPFGPGGNRGIEYGTVRGQSVRAVASGIVTFVGPVGGRRWLVVTHDNGLRSTYGPLSGSAVVRGQEVTAGQPVGEAEPGLHLTARLGDRYVDPAPLLAGRCGRARLVAITSTGGAPLAASYNRSRNSAKRNNEAPNQHGRSESTVFRVHRPAP